MTAARLPDAGVMNACAWAADLLERGLYRDVRQVRTTYVVGQSYRIVNFRPHDSQIT
jgi:hypothetical protein